MSDLILLSPAQMRLISLYFPLSLGIPRVDDRKIISGIIFVIRNGLRWRDAPKDYVRTKPSTTASFAGAIWAYSTGYLRLCLPGAANPIN
jgi:transposase